MPGTPQKLVIICTPDGCTVPYIFRYFHPSLLDSTIYIWMLVNRTWRIRSVRLFQRLEAPKSCCQYQFWFMFLYLTIPLWMWTSYDSIRCAAVINIYLSTLLCQYLVLPLSLYQPACASSIFQLFEETIKHIWRWKMVLFACTKSRKLPTEIMLLLAWIYFQW